MSSRMFSHAPARSLHVMHPRTGGLRCALLLAALGWVMIVPAAQATIGPPVSVRLQGGPRPAEAGKVYTGVFEIVTEPGAQLTGLELAGEGWSKSALQVASRQTMGKLQTLDVPFASASGDPNQPLLLRFILDGKLVEWPIDLSPRSCERASRPAGVRLRSEIAALPTGGAYAAGPRPGPAPAPVSAVHQDDPSDALPNSSAESKDRALGEGPASPQVARDIRVYGRFVYTRQPDGVVVGVDGLSVYVYDDDAIGRQIQTSGITDPTGNFDLTFSWDGSCFGCEAQPDIKVVFKAANTAVDVQALIALDYYSWETGTWTNYAGTSLNIGTISSLDEDLDAGLHILTDIVHTWRWLAENEGYLNIPVVHVVWPMIGSNAWYTALIRSIYVCNDAANTQWNEGVHSHEYGHHWMNLYSLNQAAEYCNGICDTVPGIVCGHCLWCAESDHDALNEGWPDWLGYVIPTNYGARYGTAAWSPYGFEGIGQCSSGVYGDPALTEGFLAAVVQDIQDSSQDDDPYSPGYADVLALGTNEIFDVLAMDYPVNPVDFLNKFKARFPQYKEDLWETAKEDGYEIDQLAPPAPTGLTAPGHPVGGSSGDATVDFTWTRPDDDASGIEGYSWSLDVVPGYMPDTSRDLLDVTAFTTYALAPGTYYFTLRAKDRDGHWGSAFAQYGPFTILPPEPANLRYWNEPGWSFVVVPRAFNDAGLGSVPAPAVLQGNTATTWWNLSGRNDGDQPTSTGFQARIYVDDTHAASIVYGGMAGSTNFMAINRGISGTTDPLTVRGGRHVFEARLDALEQIPESIETDNAWAHQWCWIPLTLGLTAVTRTAPPKRLAGWGSVTDGSALHYNCDGLRLSPGGFFNAVVIRASKNGDDYDCRIHPLSPTTADFTNNGFPSSNVGYSTRAAGCIDAVLTNIWRTGLTAYDVGVLNANDGLGGYTATPVFSVAHTLGDSVVVSLAANEMLQLRHFFVPLASVGPFSVTVDVTPASDPVHVLWLDDTFATGDLLDYDAMATTDAAGHARLDFIVYNEGYNGLVLYRDPKDGTGPITVAVELGETPPDPMAYNAAGWYAPLVPLPTPTGVPAGVPLPATLAGNAASTYFNFAVRNESPTEAPSVRNQVDLDGAFSFYVDWSPAHGYSNFFYNGTSGLVVRGGRHMLSLCPDRIQAIEEISETNNIYGAQYVWSPLLLTDNAPITRSAPPDPMGGRADLRSGEAFYYNCDGLRIPNTGPRWHAAAVMPGASSNVDLRLHATVLGAKLGFAASLTTSGWGTGQSDFVLVDFRTGIPITVFDVGAVRVGTGTESYTAESTGSQFLATDPQGTYGPFTLPANRIVNLHEVYLDARAYSFELQNVSGSVDWGMALHQQGVAYQGKSTTVAGGAAWFADPGAGESFTVDVATAGYYCLSVWKVGAADLPLSGSYDIRVLNPAVTRVDPPVPPPTHFAAYPNHPNPFNPTTVVRFDLPAALPVSLQIHDVTGRVVRTLLEGEVLPAGQHESMWDGRDERGIGVASGTYFYRLRAGGREAVRSMLLLK